MTTPKPHRPVDFGWSAEIFKRESEIKNLKKILKSALVVLKSREPFNSSIISEIEKAIEAQNTKSHDD